MSVTVINDIYKYIEKNSLFLAWVIAAVGTVASIALSEIFELPPCELCWWQRIALFPLAIILGIAEYKKNYSIWLYALPFTIIGALLAAYHTLIQWGVIPEALECEIGVPCSEKQIAIFGFMTIPFGAMLTFIALGILMLLVKKNHDRNK